MATIFTGPESACVGSLGCSAAGISQRNPKPKTITQLALQQTRDDVPQTTINNAIYGFRNACVLAGGGHFEYQI